MNINEWEKKYQMILQQLGYDRKKDTKSAKILDKIITKKFDENKLKKIIKYKTVLVIGAGPSLKYASHYLKKFKTCPIIVADGATQVLIENKIKPDIVVTDLDGDIGSILEASEKGAIILVHSHGDNISKLPYAVLFKQCIGTTEDTPYGKIRNFGGFTDGDRCVFLAEYFGATRIILIGMDFGINIGKYSKKVHNRAVKLKKLAIGKSLLEELASRSSIDLYTTSKSITGFKTVGLRDLQKFVR